MPETHVISVEEFFEMIKKYLNDNQVAFVHKAYDVAAKAHANQRRKSGEPYIIHPLGVATILAELQMDETTLAAAFLHDVVEDTETTLDQLKEMFGVKVADLVDGVTKLGKIEYISKEDQQIENYRKMFLAMAKDIRVIMIKLADRLHNMRTMKYMPVHKQQSISRETMEVYAPLAHRLGIYTIKWELEDLAFRYMEPEIYYDLVEQVKVKRREREAMIHEAMAEIKEHLDEQHIKCEIQGRPKNFYSIYKKMQRDHKELSEIYDLLAIRVLVDTVADCYGTLGVVHSLWRPIPGRVKDYIAVPKSNMYQSLHTTVIGHEGIPFEVQIRTREMDRNAEYGIAAHWKYKAGITAASSDRLDERLAWVRQLLESQRSSIDATDLLSDIKSDLLPEEVFAFTPRGDVINLPAGATVIDFAYAIHSAVGNRMIGAKVNNRIVPIDHQVVTGEIIEIITGPENRGPSRDWLNIVKTSEAKNKIRNWFKKERRDENIAEGKDAFEKELRRNLMVIPPEQYDEFMSNLARRNHCNSVDEMYAAIGYGGLQLARILPKLKEEYTRLKATEPKPLPTVDIKRVHSSDGVVVEGIDNCPIKFAKCCSPLPGDDIIGFVTRGFGVSIHKRDCANVQQSMKDPENAARWVKSYWADDAKEDYKATLELDCMDRANLLSDVALALGDMRVPIYSLSARAADQGRARMSLTVGIMNTVHLNNVVARLKKVKDVLTVIRN